MWGRAQLLVLLIACLTAYGDDVAGGEDLKVGRAVDLFTRYGYLSISMRVVPRNDSQFFLFREPTIDVFTNVDQFAVRSEKVSKRRIFEGDFHMEFCDNLRQLVQAYFRDFSFERYAPVLSIPVRKVVRNDYPEIWYTIFFTAAKVIWI